MFETIAAGDLLLFHPYESFEPVLRLLEEAAGDPDVVAIKQVLYRTASKSRIIDALITAAENGKHVTVLIELKARFDEARNLDRADELQRAGAQIVYGVKGLKTHAKICMIIRRESGHLRRYVHLGTGNYNETTSRLYTDLSYLTCKPEFGNDASLVFQRRLRPVETAALPTADSRAHRDEANSARSHHRRSGTRETRAARPHHRQGQLAAGSGHHQGALQSLQGRRRDQAQRPRHLLPQTRRPETLEKHRGGLHHRPLPRTRPAFLLPSGRRFRGLHLLRGLDDAQPRKARRAHDPDRRSRR